MCVSLALAAIMVVAAVLRFAGLGWGEAQWIHPDEGHMRTITSVVRVPDSLREYFDTTHSPLNSRNQGHAYSYGTLPLLATRGLAETLDVVCQGAGPTESTAAWVGIASAWLACGEGSFTGFRNVVAGRAISALAGVGTVLLVFLLARELYGSAVGLLASALSAITAFSIQQAHFYTVDSLASFFTLLVAYLAVRAGRSGRWWHFVAAGAATGLAAACKASGVYAALLVVLTACWRLLERPSLRTRRGLQVLGANLLLAGVASVLAFRVAQPYAFAGPGFFDVGLDTEWLERMRQIAAEQKGELDFPSGRQWAGRTAVLFPLFNLLVWGLGIPFGITALLAWAYTGLELVRSRWQHLTLWAWTTIVFLYLATRWVKTMRYFLPLYPLLAILTAYCVVRVGRRLGRRPTQPVRRWPALVLAGLVVAGAGAWGWAVFSIYRRPHTRVAASRWVYEHVDEGATIANEHWDWGIPLRLDGRDPFGSAYTGLEMEHYNEDTPEKRNRLIRWLDEADYVITASNRLYASIGRLPARYPLTTAYYEALFGGELGFELAAEFTSFPSIGALQFPDDELPFRLMEPLYSWRAGSISIPLPPAEEAFSVYDHPRVLVFRKSSSYSSETVAQTLDDVDLAQAVPGLTSRAAARAPTALAFDAETWEKQQAGGTWSAMFDRTDLQNRYPALAAVAWWGAITTIGWLAFPLLFYAAPALRDRGYGFAKVAGLLLIAYPTWLAASLRFLPNTRGTIWLFCLVLAGAGVAAAVAQRKSLRAFVEEHWRVLALTEAVFAGLFIAWIGVRLLNPDLWHPVVGGEKPMDFAYLNAVMKSRWFPPYNPWLSGHQINYYYFGFVFVGALVQLLGTVPSIAYNLAVPLLFAMTGVSAFSVAFSLAVGRRRTALLAALAAVAFMVLLGNLGVVRLLRRHLIAAGGPPIESSVPGLPNLVATMRGLWAILVRGVKISTRPEAWYWYPTRIVPVEAGGVVPITEFPAFTFLYGDLHAHMIALPLTLAALGLAVGWSKTRRVGWGGIVLGSLVIGALRPTNTWDYPTYLVLGAAGLTLGVWRRGPSRPSTAADYGATAVRIAGLVVVSNLLFLPYLRSYAGGQAVSLWDGSRTPLEIYFWIHGIVLFPVATAMAREVGAVLARAPRRPLSRTLSIGGAVLLAGATAALFFLGYRVALLALPFFAVCSALVLIPRVPRIRRMAWVLVGSAMVLSLLVEAIVLRDDIGRMNTVFKVYNQVWTLLAVAAAVALAETLRRSRSWPLAVRRLWLAGMACLAVGGALFLPLGIRARAVDRIADGIPPTLDGAAFMDHAQVSDGRPGSDPREVSLAGDAAAIRWMQDNVRGSPVVLEGLGHREYLWANRVSVHTGLPAVVGWRWHQVQQRPGLPSITVDQRRADVDACYETTDPALAWSILQRYGIMYVYVADYERAYYPEEGLAKFEKMADAGRLRVVFDSRGSTVYQVLDPPSQDTAEGVG